MVPFGRMSVVGALGAVLAGAVLAGGCGGKGGGSSTAVNVHAPVVTNLQVRARTPEKANQRIVWTITATVADPDGDVVGGQAEARLVQTGQVVSAAIDPTFVRGDQFAAVLFVQSAPAGRADFIFSIVDAAGNRSNEIPFFVTIAAELPRAGAPTMFRGHLEPAP